MHVWTTCCIGKIVKRAVRSCIVQNKEMLAVLRLASCSRCMVSFFFGPLTIYCKCCPMFWWLIRTLSSFFFLGLMHKLTPLLTKDHKNKPQTTSSIGFLLVLIRSDLRNFTWTITTHRLNHMIQGWWSTPVPSLAAYLVTIVCLICPPPQWKIAMSSRQARRCISRRLHLPRYRDAERCSNSEGF